MDFQSLQNAENEKEKARLLAEVAAARQSLADIRLRINQMGHDHSETSDGTAFLSALGAGKGFGEQIKGRELLKGQLYFLLTGRSDHRKTMRGEP